MAALKHFHRAAKACSLPRQAPPLNGGEPDGVDAGHHSRPSRGRVGSSVSLAIPLGGVVQVEG